MFKEEGELRLERPVPDSPLMSMDTREFNMLRAIVNRHTGIWLRDGKQVMLATRLSRRLRARGLNDFSAYCSYIENARDGGKEIGELINSVTTNKTSFFRENHHFEYLADKIVPNWRKAAGAGTNSVRIWSAACSTGEEPYSIAISLLEAMRPSPNSARSEIQVVASDIDTDVLATASRGVYGTASLDTVSLPLRGKYFLRGKGQMLGQVRVKKEVSQLVEFKRINLIDSVWPIEGAFEAIFFRNALIYFNQPTQELFLRKMVRYLKPGGHLFLGHSEHVPWLHDMVEPLSKTTYRLRDKSRELL